MLDHLNLSPTNHRILSYLVQTPEDLNEFEEWHLGWNRSILFDIAAYRTVRTENILTKLSVIEFVESYEQGDPEQKRDVLQRLFQQWVPDQDMDKLTQQIANGLSLEAIYEFRQQKPTEFVHSITRGW